MPVDTKHAQYTLSVATWQMMRSVAGGQRTMHAARETYLPKLYKETELNYAARLVRTVFFNATWRTIEGLGGMMFRKPPEVKVSPAAEPMLKDVTKSGVDFDSFARKVDCELLTVGRIGVLVDYPPTDGITRSKQETERLNLRPHMAMYTAEAIINWSTEWINNETVLSRVVLQESAVIKDANDEFVETYETRWRVLDLEARLDLETGSTSRVYRQRVFVKKDGKEVVIEGPLYPMMNGQPLTFIPFVILGTEDNTPDVCDPPLVDLGHVNVSHYQTTADLEHGAHKTAMPQPYICGVNASIGPDGKPLPKDTVLYMGGGDAWTFPDSQTTVGMLEYTGAGLETLERRLEVKEKHMAVLGARMLEQQKKAQEAAETAGIHRSGEQATLASLARMISKGLKRALGWFDEWAGGSGEVEYLINQKFFAVSATPQEIEAWVAAWQQGAISKEALFEKLQAGEVVSDERKFQDEETKIDNAAPTLLAQAAAAKSEPGENDPPPGKDE